MVKSLYQDAKNVIGGFGSTDIECNLFNHDEREVISEKLKVRKYKIFE